MVGSMAIESSVSAAAGRLLRCNPVLLMGSLSMGGSERQGYLLAKVLTGLGMKPGVVAWNSTNDDYYKDLIQSLGIPLVTVPSDCGRFGKVWWLRKVMRRVNPPILHSYAFFLNSVAAWTMRGTPGMALGSIRSTYEFEAGNGWLHYLMNRRWPEGVIVNSAAARNAAQADRRGFRPRKILFVPNGIDLSLYPHRALTEKTCPRIIGIGNLHPEKRWDCLIRAAGIICRVDSSADFEIVIVGKGTESERLAALAGKEGIPDRVVLLGRRYDVPDLLREADISVLVSDGEGTPNAVMESMAAGLPLVVTDVGDNGRLVEDGVHGFVVGRGDERALAERILRLITEFPLRRKMGENGRIKAFDEFGLEKLGENTLSAYRELGWKG